MSTDHIHLTHHPDGSLRSVDAVGAVRIEQEAGLWRVRIDTDEGEELLLSGPLLWMDLHHIPPTEEEVLTADPFTPALFALRGGRED